MIEKIKNFFSSQKSVSGKKRPSFIHARYDAAAYTKDNAKHWAAADYLSADAEARRGIRRTLRVRARYEVANNSYARGIVLTLANDTIGTGPRLQCLTKNDEMNSQIESDFMAWAKAVSLAEKLRTMRMARCQDGEAFVMLAENPNLPFEPVKLDLQLIEADRVTDEFVNLSLQRIDGITFDIYGNPVKYRVLKYHPGGDEIVANPLEFFEVKADNMIHYFRVDRPGQHRGIPEITAALPLFAQLRRFTLAVLSAAEAAADFAGILYTDNPANGEAEDISPLDAIELQRNMLLSMPGGWHMDQLDPKQPCSTYGEFKSQILNEIARCLNMPFNIAAGNSSGYNYASGRLDHQTYFKSIRVEQSNIANRVLDKIFDHWIREYSLYTGIAVGETIEHSWFWDGFEHVDPLKEANAIETKLAMHTTTYAAEFAKQGRDWEDEFVQIAKEKKRMEELGITSEDIKIQNTKNKKKEEEADE